MPCRLMKLYTGRQYVRQSFSSASCAAGDALCASSTTLQCVVAKMAAPFSRLSPVGPIPLPEAPPSLADTDPIQVKSPRKIKIGSGRARGMPLQLRARNCGLDVERQAVRRYAYQHAEFRLLHRSRADYGRF